VVPVYKICCISCEMQRLVFLIQRANYITILEKIQASRGVAGLPLLPEVNAFFPVPIFLDFGAHFRIGIKKHLDLRLVG
jgi:hypothetical protein